MKLLDANVKNITKWIGAWFGEDKFGTANGNRTRILALKGLRANRCTIAALLGELQPINYTENFKFALRGLSSYGLPIPRARPSESLRACSRWTSADRPQTPAVP